LEPQQVNQFSLPLYGQIHCNLIQQTIIFNHLLLWEAQFQPLLLALAEAARAVQVLKALQVAPVVFPASQVLPLPMRREVWEEPALLVFQQELMAAQIQALEAVDHLLLVPIVAVLLI
jgi:hypothetical protein